MKGERGERGPPGLPGRQGVRGESVRKYVLNYYHASSKEDSSIALETPDKRYH